MTSYDLTGRTACARGLGAGMAEALARAGASVAIGDIQEDTGKGTADALKESGARASCRPRRPRGHSEVGGYAERRLCAQPKERPGRRTQSTVAGESISATVWVQQCDGCLTAGPVR